MKTPRISLLAVLVLTSHLQAQDRLPLMPGYDSFKQGQAKRAGAVRGGRMSVNWSDDGKSFTASVDGETKRFTLETGEWSASVGNTGGRAQRFRERGRQYDSTTSPDGKVKAFTRDRNVFVSGSDGSGEVRVTSDGSIEKRIKNGIASWVYGEELEQEDAMWFSPDGKKLAYYRFDETNVKDYHLALNQGASQSVLDVEAYPKPGQPNPIADVFVYDLASKKSVKIDTHGGADGDQLGHYVYHIRWSDDGQSLIFSRMNRLQNRMQMVSANPLTGSIRVVLEESNPAGWVPYSPGTAWTASGQLPQNLNSGDFIWVSERTGFRNVYIGNYSGGTLRQLTNHNFDVQSVVGANPKSGWIWYTAYDGDSPCKLQLHRVKLDGSGGERLTDPKLSHTVNVSSASGWFTDIAESYETPPTTKLCKPDGRSSTQLASADASTFKANGLIPAERITFTAGDGTTICYGVLYKPWNYDPQKRYPVLVDVYGGPESGTKQERFRSGEAICDYGFLVASFDGRGTWCRGRAFRQAVYGKLGIVEIDDQAAGAKALMSRPDVDPGGIGIFGTSYGGYASAMALVRYPEVFRAASSASPVTDWRNYDSTYTERYNGLLPENAESYKNGSVMTYVRNMKGRLLLYYGTADNNVHPANSLQLAAALGRAGKSFELAVGTDQGHSAVNGQRMIEFFIDHLVLKRTP